MKKDKMRLKGQLGMYMKWPLIMTPRRITGNCAKHQRALTVAIKRARHISLMPYVQD